MLPQFFPLTRQVAPSVLLPFSVAEAKPYLKVDGSDPDEDALIEGLIRAAAEWWEKSTHTALMEAEYVTVLGRLGAELSELRGPVTQVLSLTYATEASVNTVGTVADYAISDGRPGVLLYLGSTPLPVLRAGYPEPVRVRYKAGFTQVSQVPALIKQALQLTVNHWYENRQNALVGMSVVEVPQTAQAIVRLFRDPVL